MSEAKKEKIRITYWDGEIILKHGNSEMVLGMEYETPLVELTADYNMMVDEIEKRKPDFIGEINRVLNDVDDDSVSSMQNALEEIGEIVEGEE